MTSARFLLKTRAACSCDSTQGKFCSGDLLRARLFGSDEKCWRAGGGGQGRRGGSMMQVNGEAITS